MPINDFSSFLTESDNWLLNNFSGVDEVLVILFLGRSGTIFLQSLLDSHPQVMMFPGAQLSFYEDFWENQGKNAVSIETLIRQFCSYFASFFDVYAYSPVMLGYQPAYDLGFDEMGLEKNEKTEIDKTRFISILSLMLSKVSYVDRKIFFQAIHAAFIITVGRSKQLDKIRLPIIVYPLHQNSQRSVNNLCSDFPKAKMIHMIREPLQAMGSQFKKDKHCCHIMRDYFFEAFPKAKVEQSIGVKLEDLHAQPDVTLKKVIQWIGISWSDSLLDSTFNGKKWWNIKESERLNGFNNMTVSKNYNNFYYKFDLYRLKILYIKRFKLWGYPAHKKVNIIEYFLLLPLLFFPFKMEILDFKKNVLSTGLRGIKFGLFCWLDRVRRRGYLITAWRYSLSKKVTEIRLL